MDDVDHEEEEEEQLIRLTSQTSSSLLYKEHEKFFVDDFELISQLGYLTIQKFSQITTLENINDTIKENIAVMAYAARYLR